MNNAVVFKKFIGVNFYRFFKMNINKNWIYV